MSLSASPLIFSELQINMQQMKKCLLEVRFSSIFKSIICDIQQSNYLLEEGLVSFSFEDDAITYFKKTHPFISSGPPICSV